MKKNAFLIMLAISGLFITQCKNRKSEKLVGIWKLNQMDINGTIMSGSSLGSWLWEFNPQGGYMVNIAGIKEKGWYKFENDQLTVQITTTQNRPQTIYTLARIDSVQMVLTSSTDKNKSSLSFIRMKNSGFLDKD